MRILPATASRRRQPRVGMALTVAGLFGMITGWVSHSDDLGVDMQP